MNFSRANHTSTLLPSGKVLITGGFSGTSPHAETEIYDPDPEDIHPPPLRWLITVPITARSCRAMAGWL